MRPGQTPQKYPPTKKPLLRGAPCAAFRQASTSRHLNDGLHDGALGGDGLGVRLVVALGLDQLDQFVGQVDVGLFQGVGDDRTQDAGFWRILARDARGAGFFPAAITYRLLTSLGGSDGEGDVTKW